MAGPHVEDCLGGVAAFLSVTSYSSSEAKTLRKVNENRVGRLPANLGMPQGVESFDDDCAGRSDDVAGGYPTVATEGIRWSFNRLMLGQAVELL